MARQLAATAGAAKADQSDEEARLKAVALQVQTANGIDALVSDISTSVSDAAHDIAQLYKSSSVSDRAANGNEADRPRMPSDLNAALTAYQAAAA